MFQTDKNASHVPVSLTSWFLPIGSTKNLSIDEPIDGEESPGSSHLTSAAFNPKTFRG